MGTVTIQKLNTRGEPVVAYQGELAERFASGVRVAARWVRPTLDLGYTRFETGDRFIEWFFSDRWYSIFEVRADATDALKGWYCNVASPARIEAEVIACRDLLLDLWVRPDGTSQVLDAEEFAADTTLDAATRDAAERALVELMELVAAREPPFDVIDPATGDAQTPALRGGT
jgi:hypothetical protein